jgi:hypothetical protein
MREELQTNLLALKRDLESVGANVLLDLTNLETGINQYMEEILTSDFIFLIGTPSLPARLAQTSPDLNNAQQEFEHIRARHAMLPGCLIPLVFQKEEDDSDLFESTMPMEYISQHNILMRDCRILKDLGGTNANPCAMNSYINALSGAGEVGVGLGIIPIIFRMRQGQEQSSTAYFQAFQDVRRTLILELPTLLPSTATATATSTVTATPTVTVAPIPPVLVTAPVDVSVPQHTSSGPHVGATPNTNCLLFQIGVGSSIFIADTFQGGTGAISPLSHVADYVRQLGMAFSTDIPVMQLLRQLNTIYPEVANFYINLGFLTIRDVFEQVNPRNHYVRNFLDTALLVGIGDEVKDNWVAVINQRHGIAAAGLLTPGLAVELLVQNFMEVFGDV